MIGGLLLIPPGGPLPKVPLLGPDLSEVTSEPISFDAAPSLCCMLPISPGRYGDTVLLPTLPPPRAPFEPLELMLERRLSASPPLSGDL